MKKTILLLGLLAAGCCLLQASENTVPATPGGESIRMARLLESCPAGNGPAENGLNEKRASENTVPATPGGESIRMAKVSGNVPAGSDPADNVSAESKPAGHVPEGNNPVESSPAASNSADKVPAESNPAENSSTDNVPAENELDEIRARFVRASAADYSPDSRITEEFIRYSDYGRANDVLQLQLYMSVHLPDAEVKRLLGLLGEDGAFSDIDYADRTRGKWQPSLHLTRLYALAKLYVSPESGWYRHPLLGSRIHKAVDFWVTLRPTSDNWWHNDIGAPRKLAAVLLLLGDEVTASQMEGALRLLQRSRFGRTGQNKVWLAENNLMKGLLINDAALVRRARDFISEEISIAVSGEGIQPDWAYQQHGPQIQFGNYGQTYAESVSFLMRILEGTSYAFSEAQYGIVANLLKEGIFWSVFRGVMDPSFCGRQVFKDSGRSKAFSVAVAAKNMAALGRPDGAFFQRVAEENLRPDKYRDRLTGARYYGSSDCGIYRTRDWYASIRMHSVRTIGFEFTNRENLNAWFSADGALLFMQHGGEYENISAIWDWRYVPGTTAWEDGKPLPTSDRQEDKMNRTPHVGGVSGGDVLCATMEVCRDSLHAFKTVFFFPDLVVATGADIYTLNPEVRSLHTAIDQTRLSGKVRHGRDWAWHDRRGYLLLEGPGTAGAEMTVTAGLQRGKWDPIDPSYKDDWDEGGVFKCFVSHRTDRRNAYSYAILPGAGLRETRRGAIRKEIRILRNDAGCQSVSYKGWTCIADHGPRSVIEIFRDGKRIAHAPLPPAVGGK